MRFPRRYRVPGTPGFLVALMLALTTSASAPRAPDPVTGRVIGHVRDSLGAPIPGAQVMVVGRQVSALTDRSGAYALEGLAQGPIKIRVIAAGYAVAESAVLVRPGRTLTHDVILRPLSPALEASRPRVDVSDAKELDRTRRELAAQSPVAAEEGRVSGFGGIAGNGLEPWRFRREPWNTEAYGRIEENRFLAARANPLSTFSIDVDAASYSNVRRFITQGTLPPPDAVRLEELVNYFVYRYPEPRGPHPFAVATEVGPCPWAPEHRLVRIGLQGKRLATRDLPPSNLVFLIDVSGSMMSPDKLPLVKQAFRALVGQLRPADRVAIVVYAGAAGLVLPSTSGAEKRTIVEAIDRLEAGGSTAGGAGIRLAYDVARENFQPEGNNRVILATDGDFNVGVSSDAEMVRLVEARREEGTFLTVLGFGTGNLKDSKMEQMADKGNGHYAYIDGFREAHRVFVQELGGTLVTIAKDVKIQVEFNPARVQSYRLLGYENRLLQKEDFADDRKDAGELGAGHTVTALYEVVPAGAEPEGGEDDLTYQRTTLLPQAAHRPELATVRLRYKLPTGGRSRLLATTITDRGEAVGSEDMRFASAVASFAMLLRDSDHKGGTSFDQVLDLARAGRGEDPDGYRSEFIGLVEAARTLQVASRE